MRHPPCFNRAEPKAAVRGRYAFMPVSVMPSMK